MNTVFWQKEFTIALGLEEKKCQNDYRDVGRGNLKRYDLGDPGDLMRDDGGKHKHTAKIQEIKYNLTRMGVQTGPRTGVAINGENITPT